MKIRVYSAAIFLCFLLLFVLSSCGNKSTAVTTIDNTSTKTSTQVSSTKPQARTISGTISYDGAIKSTHQIILIAVRPGEQSNAYSVVLPKPGNYTIANVTDGIYTLFAFMDTGDDMGPPQANEPIGNYDPNGDDKPDELTVKDGNGLAGIDIILLDPQ